MKCNKIYPYIASEVSYTSIENHLKHCKTCSDTLANIEQTMSILDEKTIVPAGLVEKTNQKKNTIPYPKKLGFDYSKYLQIAAVLAAGIFLGIFLGQNANTEFFGSKKQKKDKALIEFRECHLLENQNSFFKM